MAKVSPIDPRSSTGRNGLALPFRARPRGSAGSAAGTFRTKWAPTTGRRWTAGRSIALGRHTPSRLPLGGATRGAWTPPQVGAACKTSRADRQTGRAAKDSPASILAIRVLGSPARLTLGLLAPKKSIASWLCNLQGMVPHINEQPLRSGARVFVVGEGQDGMISGLWSYEMLAQGEQAAVDRMRQPQRARRRRVYLLVCPAE